MRLSVPVHVLINKPKSGPETPNKSLQVKTGILALTGFVFSR